MRSGVFQHSAALVKHTKHICFVYRLHLLAHPPPLFQSLHFVEDLPDKLDLPDKTCQTSRCEHCVSRVAK
jgi:hypothetical protein